ncbi:MAG: RidA family protein [Acidimicrobiales bacterium]
MSPTRPYSTWRRAGDFVIVSGQLGTIPGHENLTFADGAPGQLRQALTNGAALLEEAGSSLDDVVKATMFVRDLSGFAALNEVWLDVFSDPLPTRSAFGVADLPYGALVEVEFWAYLPES